MQSTRVYKYLGLHIDDQLKFSEHAANIKTKILPFIAMLRKIRFLIPSALMLSIYCARIHSHPVHLISIWGFAARQLIEQLQVLQNRTIRTVFWREYTQENLPTEEIYKRYGILKLEQLLKYDAVLSIFKMRRGMLRLNIELTTFSEEHNHDTRGRGNYLLPLTRTTTAKKSLFNDGLLWYNLLPNALKQLTHLVPFKKGLKKNIGSE